MTDPVIVERRTREVVLIQSSRTAVARRVSREVVAREFARPVLVEREVRSVVARGMQGPAGASGLVVRYETTGPISALRVVRQEPEGTVVYASSDDVANKDTVVGISVQGTGAAGGISVRRSGPLSDSGWIWTAGRPVFLGINGALTQTAPVTGFLLQVGVAIDTNTIDVRIGSPIIRG